MERLGKLFVVVALVSVMITGCVTTGASIDFQLGNEKLSFGVEASTLMSDITNFETGVKLEVNKQKLISLKQKIALLQDQAKGATSLEALASIESELADARAEFEQVVRVESQQN